MEKDKTISQILEEFREQFVIYNDVIMQNQIILRNDKECLLLENFLRSALERQKREIDRDWRERIKYLELPPWASENEETYNRLVNKLNRSIKLLSERE